MNEKKEDKEVKQYFFSFPTDIGVLCLGLNPGSQKRSLININVIDKAENEGETVKIWACIEPNSS